MGDQIQLASDKTGLSPVFLIFDFTGKVWQTTTNTFVAYVSADRADYEIAMTEIGAGASRHYNGTFDNDVSNGDFNVEIRESAGETGILAGTDKVGWNGTKLLEHSSGLSVDAIADAVWDEARAPHSTVGTFGEGVDVAPDGLDNVNAVDPLGVPNNFTERMNWLFGRFANRVTMTATTLVVFKADDVTVLTTQALDDDGTFQDLQRIL